jgi:hypothetical protein
LRATRNNQQPVGLDERGEDVLENIFGVAGVRHAPADEMPQPRLLAVHGVGNPPILVGRHLL